MRGSAPNLTDAFLRNVKPTGKRYEISDTVTRGLRARVSARGDVTFILKTRAQNQKLMTVTLGRYPGITLKTARELAGRKTVEIKDGLCCTNQLMAEVSPSPDSLIPQPP
ncbi:Arm DNA-binding domain-containing protein [Mameliella alba]|nr:Arm DNA-binding domain-containing protein [Antarctobacter heliothermus]MBY6147017.1 Arm DNA-binding domain-containing protein [Mameliella alba]MCA0957022.1 Arm DNA-binding domain-containing protein [Mameliella alba]